MQTLQRLFTQPHALFLWIALVFGAANLVLNPPFMGIDEENHFARIIGFTQGKLFESAAVSTAFAEQVKVETARIRQFFGHEGHVGGRDFFRDQNDKFSFRDTYHDLLEHAPAEDSSITPFYPYNRAVVYPPTAYLSTLPLAWVAVKSGLNPLAVLYIVRASIFLAAITLMYCAIRITPVLKWQMFLLALLQTSVFVRSSVNADPHVFGYAFLFIALVLDAFHTQEKLHSRKIWAMALLSALLCVSKPAYLLLPGIFLLLDGSKFISFKQRALSVLFIIALPIALGLAWAYVAGEYYHAIPIGNNGYIERAPDVDEKTQLLFCLTHPLTFLHSVLRTFGKLWPFYMGQLIAMQGDSQVDVSLPFGLLNITILLFPLLAFLPALNTNFTITLQQRCLCLALAIATTLLICLMMYAGNTPVGGEEIIGLQGRYFIPALPLLFLGLSHNITRNRTTEINAIILLYITEILGYSLYSLLANDYITR